ncbi:lysine decarboxylation/transport transcriptional activator CadC [Aeromonas sp. MR19]|uniref:Lysine decarboxylation/transport transcriptional activator CadC n=1 Tax=Aeromonas bestiarum TaxID=105751 RepID=A0ABT7PVF6_9GAMM|nr:MULTISPECIES: lysine decarboxylation/transport transcriptional activator CadC [Aeromonas]EKP0276629.1 lysine decarboxylation/transport transcriptional activator CadC [Aeromonas bestiarum]MCH7346117.1 lysine decarboxylation/transport transcriptional activator CadC [Aeromonas sp. MR7]MCH7375821.1 lysine decarboxylation/transport transcriptional activator CadC [Aeromonas sp. MR19]MDM5071073.1 lysine decarboxylation/transport transcriptional activator CadC [Aeromonas bestiarum]MDM5087615.1 lysi
MSESVFEIHDWTLSVDDNMLCRPDREVYLEPRLVNLLRFLASNAGTVFARDSLINEVWDGAEVTDQVVTQSIFELRKILKDGRFDATDYIITVPKRGYKLVAPVRPLQPLQVVSVVMADARSAPTANSTLSDLSPPADDEDEEAISGVAPFPAGPLTRAISTRAQDGRSRWKMISFDIFVAVILVTIVSLLSYQHTSPQVHSMLDPNLLVFRFHSGMEGDNENVRLADGITRALMGEVAAATPLRVQYGANTLMGGILPGKELSVRVSRQPGGTYLDLEYRNINTNRVLFSHQYQLSRHNVHAVLQASSQDLLRALDQPDALPGMGWPTDDAALMAMMEAHYYTNSQDTVALKRGIDLLDKSLASQPDQPLLLAERYLAGEALATLAGQSESERLQGIGTHLASLVQDGGLLPARVWEALTLQAILDGQQQQANRLLAQAASRGRSVLYHILLGKLAELDGRPEAAGDAYSQAFLMEATEQTYLLCQRLGFYSNMETLTPALFNALGQSKVKLF